MLNARLGNRELGVGDGEEEGEANPVQDTEFGFEGDFAPIQADLPPPAKRNFPVSCCIYTVKRSFLKIACCLHGPHFHFCLAGKGEAEGVENLRLDSIWSW